LIRELNPPLFLQGEGRENAEKQMYFQYIPYQLPLILSRKGRRKPDFYDSIGSNEEERTGAAPGQIGKIRSYF